MVQSNIIEKINFLEKSDVADPGDMIWFMGDEPNDFLVGIIEARNLFNFNNEFLYAVKAPMPEGLFVHKLLTIEQIGFTVKFTGKEKVLEDV